MNTKSAKNTKKLFIGVIVIMLSLLVGGWFYLQSLNPTFKVTSDHYAYFAVDSPEVSITLEHPQDAGSGTASINYSADILTPNNITTSEGVTFRELDNSVIFEISSEYFQTENNKIANIKFDFTGDFGTVELNFDEEASQLQNQTGELIIPEFKNTSFGIGIIPERTETGLGSSDSL